MDEKPSAAEQAFEEWWITEPHDWSTYRGLAMRAYLAATERAARRCVELRINNPEYSDEEYIRVIAKEFGLD